MIALRATSLIPMPNKTPKPEIITVSFRIMPTINRREAPRDFKIPISRVRSKIVVYIATRMTMKLNSIETMITVI